MAEKSVKSTAKKSSSKTEPAQVPDSKADTRLIRELANILNATKLTEIEMKRGDLEIRVAKSAAPAAVQHVVAAPAARMAAASTSQPVATKETPADAAAHPGAVKSPMVGTAYTRPSPDADTFVKVGDKVKEGDTIMLVEAMKTFNPITAPKSGKIDSILVDDATPVEFGESLFVIV